MQIQSQTNIAALFQQYAGSAKSGTAFDVGNASSADAAPAASAAKGASGTSLSPQTLAAMIAAQNADTSAPASSLARTNSSTPSASVTTTAEADQIASDPNHAAQMAEAAAAKTTLRQSRISPARRRRSGWRRPSPSQACGSDAARACRAA